MLDNTVSFAPHTQPTNLLFDSLTIFQVKLLLMNAAAKSQSKTQPPPVQTHSLVWGELSRLPFTPSYHSNQHRNGIPWLVHWEASAGFPVLLGVSSPLLSPALTTQELFSPVFCPLHMARLCPSHGFDFCFSAMGFPSMVTWQLLNVTWNLLLVTYLWWFAWMPPSWA